MNSKPNIAHLVLSLETGGLEVLVSKIILRQSEQGLTVHVLCLDAIGSLAESLVASGVRVTLLSRKQGKLDFSVVRELRRYKKKNKIDLFHTHDFESYLYGIFVTAYSTVPLIHTQHGLVQDFSRLKKVFARLSLIFDPALVAVSNSVAKHMAENFWWNKNTSRVILNGVDTDVFAPNPALKVRVRQELGLSLHEFVVICVARLAPVKDHKTLIRVFYEFCVEHSQVALLVVGDGPLKSELQQFVKERDELADKVSFLGERSDVADLLQAADVFALTSLSEGISISLLEGMAVGLVPLATAVGGNTELIQSGRNGLLFDTGDDKSGTALMSKLYLDSEMRQAVSTQARQTVIERFSFRQMMAGYEDAYREILGVRKDLSCN